MTIVILIQDEPEDKDNKMALGMMLCPANASLKEQQRSKAWRVARKAMEAIRDESMVVKKDYDAAKRKAKKSKGKNE